MFTYICWEWQVSCHLLSSGLVYMWTIGAVKSVLPAVPAGLLCLGVVCCLGFAGTGFGGVLVFLIMLTFSSLACLFLLRSLRQ